MSKIIVSPVEHWPGSVTLADPLTFPQYMAWRRAVLAAGEAKAKLPPVEGQEAGVFSVAEAALQDEISLEMLPGICACVEKWDLAGLGQLTPETFPASPRLAAGSLIAWLAGQISMLIAGEEAIPKA
jgi:hypothetical protein